MRVENPISEYQQLFQHGFLFHSTRIIFYVISLTNRLFLYLRRDVYPLIIAFGIQWPKRLIQT